MTIRETVSFHDQLTWWGRALRAARHPVLATH
jgi:hypothetical protein